MSETDESDLDPDFAEALYSNRSELYVTDLSIPDDLMKVAREVADDHDAKMESLYGPTASTRRAYMIELIAVALAAERERATLAERSACAGIAQDPYRYLPSGEFCEESVVIRAIEAAILARP